jgi:signal transduction histidine kinase
MQVEIAGAALVALTVLLVLIDIPRTSAGDLHGNASSQTTAAGRAGLGSPGGTAAATAAGGHAGTGMTGAAHGAGLRGLPEHTSPPAGRIWHAGTRPGPRKHARAALTNWPARLHLFLLAAIAAIAAVIVTLCVSSLARSLQSAAIHSQVVPVRDGAIRSAVGAGVLAAAVAALAVWSAIIVTRSIRQPLRRLRAGAVEVAAERMPDEIRQIRERGGQGVPPAAEPVAPGAVGEIAEVARAFDEVHGVALRLAASEAAARANLSAMLVNLSHRAGFLADRQVRLLDDLVQGEPDPVRLARLYKLDRLAARSRHFSQSLLVLAGQELSGQWNQPMTLTDVIRAAVSEIEDQQRVSLAAEPGITIRAPAVSDLAHLLAELAENATSLSAADTPVVICGRWLPTGGVLVDVTDRGFGMSADEMAQANWQLENPGQFAFHRSMGLFMVGRLAARHGIRVRLQPADVGGLTALVWLPDDLIMHQAAAAGPGSASRS